MDTSQSRRSEYVARINRVMDYIESHLTEELSLEVLAKVACFSSFHFHRVFAAMTGETLNQFVRRLRVEKAAAQLLTNPGKSVTEVALDCGFSGSSVFARVFKESFGMSALEWQRASEQERTVVLADRKIGQAFRKPWQAADFSIRHVGSVLASSTTWRIDMTKKPDRKLEANVTITEFPSRNVIYARHVGPYAGQPQVFQSLFGRLYAFAGPRGLLGPGAETLCVYHDSPEVCDEEKLRVDACLTVPPGTPVEGEIGTTVIPGGKFAVGHFELDQDEYSLAWGAMAAGWLPESGYQFDDRLAFELYRNNPDEHPEKKCVVDICIPVRPM
jgi:AraC family transcriptional regulator